jgi:cellulose synthase/poly-beta-1,6-N-acetylglucosamine synthase-like glycosyltransferase
MTIILMAFYLCVSMIIYVYIGYPVTILLLSLLINKRVKKAEYLPNVTILIAAHNEESCIEETLRNKLNLDYPKEQMEIIVVSDASTDNTDNIVRRYTNDGISLLRQEPRSGKTSALNMAVPYATGEIIVFSDANSMYATDTLRKLMEVFTDRTVGYVTGKMVYTDPDGSVIGEGCSTYMQYENYLRTIETRIGSIVGVDGGVDGVRKLLYRPMNQDQLPDFVLPLSVVAQGYRVVYEPNALLTEASLKTSKDEYKMRTRVSLRTLWALKDMRDLLSLNKYGIFAWQLWSHKVLRYFCFIFLIGAYLTNALLWFENNFFRLLLILQSICYIGAALSPVLEKKGYRILSTLNYFVLVNWAAAYAFMKFLTGQKQTTWTPRKG